jgi:transcriptional regulator with XRE-family HTH domain
MTENIYKAIREIRVQKGLTQQFMADKLGLSQNNYGKLERGLIQLTVERLEQIAAEFGLSPIAILTYQNEVTHTSGFPVMKSGNGSLDMTEKVKMLEERINLLTEKAELFEEQKNFKNEQLQTLTTFIKSVITLVSQMRESSDAPSTENEKIYLDFIYKINYTAERIFGKIK